MIPGRGSRWRDFPDALDAAEAAIRSGATGYITQTGCAAIVQRASARLVHDPG